MTDLPLAGLRVLDRSARLAGAYAAKLLRDVGADVVLAEAPRSPHPLRRRDPAGVRAADEDSPLFRFLQAGKASVDHAAADEIADLADIVIDDDPSRGTRDRGVTVTISDFGATGPWAGRPCSHLTLEAEAGSLGSRGVPELPPVAVGGTLGEWVAGVYAATAALAAWRTARTSATAEHVEVSVFECMLVTLNMHEPLHAALSGSDAFLRWVQVPSVEPVADGWVCFSLVTGQQWLDFATMIGRPDLGEDASLANMLGRWPRRDEMYAAMDPWLRTRTVDDVVETASAFRLPVAHVTDGSTVAGMAQFRARDVFVESPYGYPQPAPPYRFSSIPVAAAAPAPAVATDTATVRQRWAQPRPSRPPAPARRPLDGVRIVDLTAFWAGPSGSHYLTALGADVVKVESVQRPDGIRFAGGQITRDEGWWEWSWVFQGANAGKRGITLDLTRADGRDLLHQLLAGADVLMENYSPRVMTQFGLTWEALSAAYPSLVVMRMPAFGLDGPWADRVGFALTMEALAGMATVTGHQAGRPTCPGGVLDPVAGMHAAFAVLVALEHREHTGAGQLVEVPMIESALNVAAEPLLEFGAHGVTLTRRGNRAWCDALQDVYRCSGDEEWVAVTVDTDERAAAVAALVTSATHPAPALDPGWRLPGSALDRALSTFLARSAAADAVDALVAVGVPAGVVRRPTTVGSHPHVVARGFYEPHDHPALGRVGYPVVPTRFRTWTGPVWPRPAPTLGQHNAEVLRGELGVDDDRLAGLERDGIIGSRPAGL